MSFKRNPGPAFDRVVLGVTNRADIATRFEGLQRTESFAPVAHAAHFKPAMPG